MFDNDSCVHHFDLFKLSTAAICGMILCVVYGGGGGLVDNFLYHTEILGTPISFTQITISFFLLQQFQYYISDVHTVTWEGGMRRRDIVYIIHTLCMASLI